MICPNCQISELEVYDYEDTLNNNELIQRQCLWCPNCRYHCVHKVSFVEIAREVIIEEK